MRFLILLLLTPLPLLAFQDDPWGRDCDLTVKTSPIKHSSPSLFSRTAQKLIRFHQTVISPIDGPRSHFYPCSSQYTLNAVRRYGFIIGFQMGCDRLMRENTDPWVYPLIEKDDGWTKYDPIPILNF